MPYPLLSLLNWNKKENGRWRMTASDRRMRGLEQALFLLLFCQNNSNGGKPIISAPTNARYWSLPFSSLRPMVSLLFAELTKVYCYLSCHQKNIFVTMQDSNVSASPPTVCTDWLDFMIPCPALHEPAIIEMWSSTRLWALEAFEPPSTNLSCSWASLYTNGTCG